jgi:hypothetical protein
MSNGDEKSQTFFWIAAGISVLLAGGSVLIGAINLGATIVATWVVVVFQILIVLLAAIFVLAAFFYLYTKVVQQLDELRRSHKELFASFKRRTGAAAAITTLFATAVVFFADKSFEGERKTTPLLISLILAIAFWLANELITGPTTIRKVSGFTIWGLGIVLLPVAVMIDGRLSAGELLSKISMLELHTKLCFASAALVMVVTPLVLSWREGRA